MRERERENTMAAPHDLVYYMRNVANATLHLEGLSGPQWQAILENA